MRRYRKKPDERALKAWLQADEALIKTLPKLGAVVGDEQGSIAMGFLRRLEGGFAVMDSMIVDPLSSGKRRYRALDVLTETLLGWAQVKQMKGVFAATIESAVVKRALRHGFERLPHQVLAIRRG